jgi:hypothetical protein
MFRSSSTSAGTAWPARFLWPAALFLGLLLGGCAHLDEKQEEKLPGDDMSSTCRKLRQSDSSDPGDEAWGMSNKSVQISRDLGYH